MFGYNKSHFVNLSPATATDLECDLCGHVCADAMATDCHKNICRKCLDAWLRRPNVCPECKREMTAKTDDSGADADDKRCHYGPNHVLNATIDKLVIRCGSGCGQAMPVWSLPTHANTCFLRPCKPIAAAVTPEVQRLKRTYNEMKSEYQSMREGVKEIATELVVKSGQLLAKFIAPEDVVLSSETDADLKPDVERLIDGQKRESIEWQKEFKKVKTENNALRQMVAEVMHKLPQIMDKLKPQEEVSASDSTAAEGRRSQQ